MNRIDGAALGVARACGGVDPELQHAVGAVEQPESDPIP